MKKNSIFAVVAIAAISLLSACDKLKDLEGLAEDIADAAMTCGAACENIQSCEGQVTPPSMDLGFGDVDLLSLIHI